MSDSLFTIKDIRFGYDKKHEVLQQISTSITAKKITAVIGPNGCGKTTLFGILAKNLKPLGGEIIFANKPLSDYSKKDFAKRVSVVHQYNTIFDDFTVRDLVALGRTPHHNSLFSYDSKEDKDIIDDALNFTQVAHLCNRQVKELSGGQLQRVWLALAIAQSKEVLLLDEITTYLDIHYQYRILNLLKDLNSKFGTTVIMVLHDINQAMQFADETIIMNEGKIVYQGKTEKIITEEVISKTYQIATKIIEIGGKSVCLFEHN